ncbi:hypothetical protein EMPS_07336 [Entomortierella parvispora]|uniref:Thioredoxin domain-containing protein n=1 Tax=Entomortierella parvispora TaxID=205924 RepID=A0A9P3LYC4_9FUNG|nr:hypothetical protein EMPS_07336 [Entomortierella parvispora]
MADTQELTAEQKTGLNQGFMKFFAKPFETKYEDKFVESEFWEAVEGFKAHGKELGLPEDPIEYMKKKGSFPNYEAVRDYLKAGPPAFAREGWVSEFVGETVDTKELIGRCEYLAGPKFLGDERVVVLDFWATWCGSCIEAAPVISDWAEKQTGKVAVVGINNDAIFGPDKPHDLEKVKTAVEAKKDVMRYTIVVDSDHQAKNDIFMKAGFMGVPCMVVVVDNKVTFVGDFEAKAFQDALDAAIEVTARPKEE